MESGRRDELEQVKDEALELGRRLGLLLAAADLPEAQKEAWLQLIPSMDAQQMSDFAKALERYVPDAEEEAFAVLAKRLGEERERYVRRVEGATDAALKELDDIEKELPPPAS